MTPDELLAAAYALDGPDANRSLYAQWAATYDTGFIVDSGYRYHEHVARVFAEHAAATFAAGDAVVDIGCGTGLGGHALQALAGVAIDGIDISAEMLGQAARKHRDGTPTYRRLIEADLTVTLPLPDGGYAGAFSIGTFTHGHVGPEALREVVRIVRPGGTLAIGVNAAHFESAGFAAVLDALTAEGAVHDLRFVEVPIYADLGDTSDMPPDDVARIAVFTAGQAPV